MEPSRENSTDIVKKMLGGKLLGARVYTKWFPVGENDAVLNVGCGKGTELFAYWFAGSRWKSAVGVDRDRQRIEEAQRLANTSGLPAATFAVADAERLPFADGSFDKVLAIDLIQYVSSPPEAIFELTRVLKSGGELLITFPAFWHYALTGLSRLKARLLWREWRRGGSLSVHNLRVGAWLELAARQNNLRLLRSRASTLFPPLQRYGVPRFWFSKNIIHAMDSFFCKLPILKNFGQALVCVYQKT